MAEAIAIDIGKGLAVEAAKALSKLLTGRPLEELRLVWGFKNQLQKLNRRLMYVQAFLDDIGHSKFGKQTSKLVTLWLQNFMDVVYFTEDVMAEYSYEILRRKLERSGGVTNRVRDLFKRTNRVKFRFRMTRKVGVILEKFEELRREAMQIGLKPFDLVNLDDDSMNIGKVLTYVRGLAEVGESDFIGRKNDEEKLLHKICSPGASSGSGLPIYAIVGIGGLGKTTLAKRLYTNEEVSRHFDKLFWVCVSEKFDVAELLNEMIKSTLPENELSYTAALVIQLQDVVQNGRFLLVLDDVWNENAGLWVSFKRNLQRIGGSPGSMVLITTRSNEVARTASAEYKHILTGLSEEESWALFKLQFHQIENLFDVTCFENVGRSIVEKCRGVPLAIKMVGRSLQLKNRLYEWEKVEKSELWQLDWDECSLLNKHNENHILPWLLSSYNNLPSLPIKQCFAYCSIFPKGCSIDKDDLIGLWLAQGYLQNTETRNLTVEEVGDVYFKVLMNNLFLDGEKNGITGRITTCTMHDLVHDLAVYVTRKDLFVWKEGATPNNEFSCRHLAVDLNLKHTVKEFPNELTAKKLRTINLLKGIPLRLFDARYLRTLIADGIGLKMVVPDIGRLKLLNYLDLSNNPIKELPEAITDLYQLQTLKLKGCEQLIELPRKLHNLVNLRHIITSDHFMHASSGLKQLTCMQTLPGLALRYSGWTIDELRYLQEIRGSLDVSGLEHVKNYDEANSAEIWKKSKVLRLRLIWSDIRAGSNSNNDEEVLNGLEPHPYIETLVVGNFNGVRFPQWMMQMIVNIREPSNVRLPLSNLKGIKLVNCRRCNQLPMLGQLPNLNYIYLQKLDVDSIDENFYSNDQINQSSAQAKALFPALRELHIWNFCKLTSWSQPSPTLGVTTFPCLEILKVMDCPRLESIPSIDFKNLKCLSLQELAGAQSLDLVVKFGSLTSLGVYDISELKILPQELLNCKNLQKLDIWSCEHLDSLPTNLPASLKTLDIRDCPALTSVPGDIFQGLTSLYKLAIQRCNRLKNVPNSLEQCRSLKQLDINQCPLIQAPLPNLIELLSLNYLHLIDAGVLTNCVLEVLQKLPHLQELGIGGYKDENELQTHFVEKEAYLTNQYISVIRLLLCDGSVSVKSLPQQMEYFSNVRTLMIKKFDGLEEIPSWICNLSSLEELGLDGCKNLKVLPSQKELLRLNNFWYLRIDKCPLLANTYGEGGSKWVQISHLACIVINGKVLQSKERN